MIECSQVTDGLFCGLLLCPSLRSPQVSEFLRWRVYLCEGPAFPGLWSNQLKSGLCPKHYLAVSVVPIYITDEIGIKF